MYLELKALHVSLAIISTLLFLLRLGLSWWGKRPTGWQRGLPHLIDTLLLLSALGLVHLAMPWPLPVWLQVKLGLLVLYIVLAAFALRSATKPVKALLSALALGSLAGIFYLAVNKPWW
ncbi:MULTISPECIES: SirB2 family protein [Pseudomonadaceae]|uniref:Regulator SirB n=1 Tax=Pseudomonas denitrificans TaxID=43306 RepID=A0A9X7R757_PSEDE|nr:MULTISPECIES: SirB2 family protein [Pseudomonadaceae]MBD9516362.1 SirB2 family protein [Pseudomonas sp. PDM22]OQR34215.1 regulator SirB [Pseudomonas sp. T]QEY75261.1 regulator SirB [Pseudomonas denitrificans (nom. rej.)]